MNLADARKALGRIDVDVAMRVFSAAAPSLLAVCGGRYLMQSMTGSYSWQWTDSEYQEAAAYFDDQGWLTTDRTLTVTPLGDSEPVTVVELTTTEAGRRVWFAFDQEDDRG